MTVIDAGMQPFTLTLDKFLQHAASRRLSAVLACLGVRNGDRVATLAWNTQSHVEAWYAIMGMAFGGDGRDR